MKFLDDIERISPFIRCFNKIFRRKKKHTRYVSDSLTILLKCPDTLRCV